MSPGISPCPNPARNSRRPTVSLLRCWWEGTKWLSAVMWLLVLLVCVAIAAGEGDDVCSRDSPGCDGVGVAHLPVGYTQIYSVEGFWALNLLGDVMRPRTASTAVDVRGRAGLTRVSRCRLKIDLWNVSFSDWQEAEVEVVESWVVVSGGTLQAVCRPSGAARTRLSGHLHALARGVVSSVMNVVPELGGHSVTAYEGDEHGHCTTHYQVTRAWAGGREVVRTKDLAACGRREAGVRPLSIMTDNATLNCHQQYTDDGKGKTLHHVFCQQTLTLPSVAVMNSNLTLSLLQTHPLRPHSLRTGTMQELNLEMEVKSRMPLPDQKTKAYNLLSQMCDELSRRITSKAALLYPSLVEVLGELELETLLQLYQQINNGRLCPHHQRLRGVFSGALRDSSTPNAAAAKCSLITDGLVRSSSSWALSLANVKQPTPEALYACAGLLTTDHWDTSEVLGLAAMAGHATCNGDEECSVVEAARRIAHRLRGKLTYCPDQEHQNQVLLAIRGLGNMKQYGHEVETGLQLCGGNTRAPDSVRVAAITALGRGPCSSQVVNWLKWELLNETLSPEIRITAFQSLKQCSEEEAEAVATLITQRDSHPQVKSYVSDFLSDGTTSQGTHEFSRHLVANFTALLGLPDTYLYTDTVFQDSFLPRSIGLNLSSPLLKHVGGSIQLGARLENLEDLLEATFGPKGVAGDNVEAWLSALVMKVQQIFTVASQDFTQSHERTKRSYSLTDVIHLLDRVQHDAVTVLRGWMSAGLGGQERLFFPYIVEPLTLHWEELFTSWVEDLLETAYSSLLNSNVELTTSWAEVEEQVLVWNLVGTPIELWQQEGGLVSVSASSKVDLLSLLTNPQASTLKIGLGPSMGLYSRLGLSLNSLSGKVVAATTTQTSAAGDVSAVLTLQGSDRVDVKVDLPHSSFHGYSIQITQSLELPEHGRSNHEEEVEEEEVHGTFNEIENSSTCFEEGDTLADSAVVGERERVLLVEQSCGRALDTALGIKTGQLKQWTVSQHAVALKSYGFLRKREGITGYRIMISWKNPGMKSLFLDTSIEAEGTAGEYKAGLVLGLTYGPHYSCKVLLQSREYSASAEATLVNDPNLKRIDGHVGYQGIHYGLKAELLMVQNGGHVSVKPRLVVSYPGMQEDALLEGYLARYFSDKVTSVTIDLYTEGSLKTYLDITLKGTAEVKHTTNGTKTVTLENVQFSSQHLSLGLESTLSWGDRGAEGRVEIKWGGQVVKVDGSVIHLEGTGKSGEEQVYQLSLQVLLPSHPHLTTSIQCLTKTHDSQMMNNLTIMMGSEADRHRQFEVLHSTSWRVAEAESDPDNQLPQIVATHHDLAVQVENKLWITSPDAAIEWKVDHILEVTERSLENLVTAVINEEHHIVKAKFYDQTEEVFKYHIELELSLPSWHFSYVDTLEQQAGGEVLGFSTTVMPSGRVYTTTTTYRMAAETAKLFVEIHFEILIQDGTQSWNISGQQICKWNSSGIILEASVKAGKLDVFGLEISLEGASLAQVDFHAKTWAKDLYEGEMALGSEDSRTNFYFNLLVIPFNQEVISSVALDHRLETGRGKLDGKLSWDVREDPSSALTLSSALQLPHVGSPLQISGSLSVLHWTWVTELLVDFGEEVGDKHKVSFIFILPDKSRFETGSQMDLSFSQRNFSVMTGFYLVLPGGDTHNLSVSTKGILGHELSKASLGLDIDSPISQEIHFLVQIVKKESDHTSNLDFKLQTHSEAEYWEAFSVATKGKWDGRQMDGVTRMNWGDVAVHLNVSGLYDIEGNEHHVAALAELKVPSLPAWSQLKSSIEGKLCMEQNPSTLKVTQISIVEKDYEEVFSSRGEVSVLVPEINGSLTVFHSGNYASRQSYNLKGKFTGQEVEMSVSGTVDGEPMKAVIHYVHSKQLRVHASYRSEDYLSLSFLTELQDFLIGAMEEGDPAYSLSTEGQLVVLGQHTKMSHHLSISPSLASSSLKIVPIEGKVFMLKTTRTKLGLNHWRSDISLTWGQRIFSYHDEVNIPSLTELSLRIEVDAPALLLNSVMVMVEAMEEAQGGKTVKLLLQKHNATIHSARVLFYKYVTNGESVWQAGATEVVVNSQTYRDIMFHHAVIPLTSGLEVKSNMTVGHTPLVMVEVRVTPDTRVLVLALCTTDEECVRVQTQAMEQNTPSTRTFSISVRALNSLFWKDPHEPFTQNSVTFLAEETADRTLVSGGVIRLECEEVGCFTSTSKGVLHTSLLLTHDTLDVMVNTTHRTIVLASVLRKGRVDEMPKTSLPGGILSDSTILENQLWLDREHNPQGAINWTTNLAAYTSSRALELALSSSLHHPSFAKTLDIKGSLMLGAESTISLSLVLDIFSREQDALKVDVEMQQERGKYILHSILTIMHTTTPIADATAIVVPSPDSSKISLAVVLPTITSAQFPARVSPTQHFQLVCGLDTLEDHTTLSCKLMTPSVHEEVSVGYQRWETIGCVGGTTSLGLLNHTHQFQHISCHDPANLQMKLSHSAEGRLKEKLSLKLGVVDVHRAEVDLLGAAGISVQLHPPFLLHVSAHHSQSFHIHWNHIIARAQEEVGNLTFIAKNVVKKLMEDLARTDSLSLLNNSISTPILTQHIYTQGIQIFEEMQHDQLMLDIMRSIQASIDVTSIIVEAGFACISHNYGEIFHKVVTGVRVWLEAVATKTGALCVQLMEDIQENFSNIVIFINNIPHLLLDQVMEVPLLNEAMEWVFAQIRVVQESTVYGVIRESLSIITKAVDKALSLVFSEEATLSNKKYSEVWNIWGKEPLLETTIL
ncbi:uncharacterized protein LOC126984229 isoform X3 [Eriocheir sinensis]|uniref:uncharacterized protein LOC126984229 isoform X3 n=1 Tax=Eriocheir sinensis TaxID=95602 RepID=UPI0021C56EEE|nr:uncharacterized protein LOC126984229 isoform X3 [Eriocheir sinensis]